MSPRRNCDSPNPCLASDCGLPPEADGGTHSPAGEGLGESQFWRLEIKLSTLPTLWLDGTILRFCHMWGTMHEPVYHPPPPSTPPSEILIFKTAASGAWVGGGRGLSSQMALYVYVHGKKMQFMTSENTKVVTRVGRQPATQKPLSLVRAPRAMSFNIFLCQVSVL